MPPRLRPALAAAALATLALTGTGCVSWDPIVLPSVEAAVRWWMGC